MDLDGLGVLKGVVMCTDHTPSVGITVKLAFFGKGSGMTGMIHDFHDIWVVDAKDPQGPSGADGIGKV